MAFPRIVARARRTAVAAVLSALALLAGAASAHAAGKPFCVVSNLAANTVSVIDATDPPAVTATVPVGAAPEGVAITPDGKTALVADAGDGIVLFIDTATNAITGGVGVGVNPSSLAVTPDGSLAFVANLQSASISVIDMTARTVTATVPVFDSPDALAVSGDGRFLYVGSFGNPTDSSVMKIDVAKLATPNAAVVEAIPTAVAGFGAAGLALSRDGKTLYVADELFHVQQNKSVAILDVSVSPAKLTGFVGPFADFPGDVALTPDGASLLVNESGRVHVVPVATGVIGPSLPGALGAVAFPPGTGRTYFTSGSDSVWVFGIPPADPPLNILTVGLGPFDIACGARPAALAMARFIPIVAVDLGARPGTDRLAFAAGVTLGVGNNGIDPTQEGLKLELGTFTLTLPAGGFARAGATGFAFSGVVDGAKVAARIQRIKASVYTLEVAATGASLRGVTSPTPVRLTLGDDQGTATVKALIRR